MSQQFPESASERNSNNSPAFVADHDEDYEEFAYASLRPGRRCEVASENPTYFAPFHEPIVDHYHTLLPQQLARTSGRYPLAQAEHNTGPQYSCQINPWNAAAFNVNHSVVFNPDAGFYDVSFNLPYEGIDLGFASQLPPVYAPNNVYDQFQPMMPTPNWPQPNSAFQPTPAPARLTAPVPPTTDAASIRCPEGCPETFGRNEEMRRHMKKHQVPLYKCPIYNCAMTFYRKDKLQDHAKKGHKGRDVLNIC